jgi:protein gp37
MFASGWGDGWDNVWLGVSSRTRSGLTGYYPFPRCGKIRFISAEPLLEEVDLLQMHKAGW